MRTAKKIVNELLENDELDPKDFVKRATVGLSPETRIKFQCPFTAAGEGHPVPRPYYFSDELGDWASPEDGGWDAAEAFRLGDYIHNGVLDLNDFPFGTESVIIVNPDGSPGKEFTIEELTLTAKVIDSYVSPDQENEEHRDRNPDQYYPRAAEGDPNDPHFDPDMGQWNPNPPYGAE